MLYIYRLASSLGFVLSFTVLGATAVAQTAPSSQTQADQLLAGIVERLQKSDWLDTSISQESRIHGIHVQSTGRMVVAKGRRLFHQLEVRAGSAKGTVKLVCDGETHWRLEKSGSKVTIRTVGLAKLDDALREANGDEVGRQLHAEIMAEYGLLGIVPVIRDLQERIRFTSIEEVELEQGDQPPLAAYRLDGEWNERTLNRLAPPAKEGETRNQADVWKNREGFLNIPRRCAMYVTREPAPWPHRIEWHGPTRVGGPDELLAATEFRNPSLEPSSVADDTLFSFEPSPGEEKLIEEVDPAKDIQARRTALDEIGEAQEKAKTLRAR